MIELRAASGGEDARIFVREMIKMYSAYCKKQNITCDLISAKNDGEGIRFAVLRVSGRGAEQLLGESGVHSIQHITRSRKKNRIHTSTVTVVALRSSDIAEPEGVDLSRDEIRLDTFRGSGAGGQHRNKTDSAVRALHVLSGEMVTITSGRSQHKNREEAKMLLALRLTEKAQSDSARLAAKKRRPHTSGERARALRTYDLIRNVVRCADGRKVSGADKILAGEISQLL